LEAADLCDEVGYGIAARTLDCTDDQDLANRRYEQFDKQLTCAVGDIDRAPVDDYMRCPIATNEVPCPELKAFGDDLVGLVEAASPKCANLFAELGGSKGPAPWGDNPFFDHGLETTGLCPNPAQGDSVEVVINNPRGEPVVVLPVDLPCEEQPVSLVIPATSSGTVSGPIASVIRVRTIEGALLVDIGVLEDLVVEVPP